MTTDEDEINRLRKETEELATRRAAREAEERADSDRARELTALQALAAESSRLERRRREDEARKKQRQAEDDEDRRREERRPRREDRAGGERRVDEPAGGLLGRLGPPAMTMGPAPAGSRSARGRLATRASTRETTRDLSPVRRSQGTSRRFSPVGMDRRESMASSFDEPADLPDTATSTTTRSQKRSAEGSQRDTSRSESRGGTKRARKAEPLIPGVKCQRCKARHLPCIPVGSPSKTCRACRTAKTKCANPTEAGTDPSWYDAARELGADPAPEDRVYGPVSSPAHGFEDVDDYLWARWLDIDSRIHLQVIDAIDRTNRHLEDHSEIHRDNANASILSAISNFHAEAARQAAAGNGDYYAMVRHDYEAITGADLGPHLAGAFRGQSYDEPMEPAEGTPHAPVAGPSRTGPEVIPASDDADMEPMPEEEDGKPGGSGDAPAEE